MIWAVIIILIICVTILIAMYVYCCSENHTGMFARPEYNARLGDLERSNQKLIHEIEELKTIIKEQHSVGGFKIQ